ncbi:MAG: hypothetical protein ACOC2M_01780 [bacterium]
MKYILNNVKCLKDKNLEWRTKQLIKKQTSRLSGITNSYHKPVTVNIFFNHIDNVTFQVSSVIVLREHVVYLKERSSHIEAAIHRLFDKLKLVLTRKIQKEKKDYLYQRKRTRLKNFHENLQNLQDLRQEITKETFKKFTKILLHDVSRYIKRRIRTTELTTELKKGTFKIQDLLDELFLVVYDRFNEIPAEKDKITVWLYKKADEQINDKLKEYQFNNEKLVRLENVLGKELKSFDEQFTVDADEEIIPMEELEDFIPKPNDYSLYDLLFDENEDSLIEDLTLKLNQDKIQKIIHLQLAKLPEKERTVIDLFLIDQFAEEEIAEIKGLTKEEVRTIIEENIKQIKYSLSNSL